MSVLNVIHVVWMDAERCGEQNGRQARQVANPSVVTMGPAAWQQRHPQS